MAITGLLPSFIAFKEQKMLIHTTEPRNSPWEEHELKPKWVWYNPKFIENYLTTYSSREALKQSHRGANTPWHKQARDQFLMQFGPHV